MVLDNQLTCPPLGKIVCPCAQCSLVAFSSLSTVLRSPALSPIHFSRSIAVAFIQLMFR